MSDIRNELEKDKARLVSLDDQLAQARQKLTDLQTQKQVVEARIEAFEMALEQMEEMQASKRKKSPATRKTRRSRFDWNALFERLYATHLGTFGYDDIMEAGRALGMDLNRASLRTKMMNLKEQNVIDDETQGRFFITEQGVNHFDISKEAQEDRQNLAMQGFKPVPQAHDFSPVEENQSVDVGVSAKDFF